MLTACATEYDGNKALAAETRESISGKFKVGETTKDQVRNALGAPIAVVISSRAGEQGKLEWRYYFDELKPSPQTLGEALVFPLYGGMYDAKRKELIVLFEKDGRLASIEFSQSELRRYFGFKT
jgi:outer membrane protein assembly factor BamE (lipoprotein component of BamABCDE complex)